MDGITRKGGYTWLRGPHGRIKLEVIQTGLDFGLMDQINVESNHFYYKDVRAYTVRPTRTLLPEEKSVLQLLKNRFNVIEEPAQREAVFPQEEDPYFFLRQ